MLDYEHYLSQQILPPIERLCEPIEGTDKSRLAECLGESLSFPLIQRTLITRISGLDPNRYRTSAGGDAEERYFGTLDSLMSDAERFQDTDPFVVRCRSCNGDVTFTPFADREVRPPAFCYSPTC